MNVGDKIVLTEDAIVVDALGTDYLLKGTTGVLQKDNGAMLVIKTAKGTYDIPVASAMSIQEDKAA
jgi:hypothetical protein